jgi:hypothetical protein
MVEWRRVILAGVPAGLVSGAAFSAVIYILAFSLMSGQATSSRFDVMGIGPVIMIGAACGVVAGICIGLVYAVIRGYLPSASSPKRALVATSVSALPWGLLWLFIIPLGGSAVPTDLMLFIHHFGIETPWVDVNTSTSDMTELAGLLSAGAYFTAYLLAVLAWTLLSGVLLGYLWDKRISLNRASQK